MLVTTRFDRSSASPLIERLPAQPMTFIREGDGLVGWGIHTVLTASGPNRAGELADQWRELVASANVDDEVNIPGSGLVAFGAISFDDLSAERSVLIVPQAVFGTRDGDAWVTTIDGAAVPAVSEIADTPVMLRQGELSRNGFKRAVDSALEAIARGEVEKVVLARDLVGEVPEGFDVRAPIARLAERYPACWVYCVDGMFGASPELLVRVSHSQVSARVLAGTAGRGTDPGVDQAIAEALAQSHKNLAEHSYAVDSMVRALAPYCEHVDADDKPFSLKLPNVWHLASDVHGVLRDQVSALDLVSAIHPTAAVAGTPRDVAQKMIRDIEPFDRGRYAGAVGWIGADGDGEWAIALRGAQLSENQVRAFAGCGIVAESDAESEALETELKFQPIVAALAGVGA